MKLQNRRKALIIVLSVICIILSIICWLLFDASIDRSGWVERNGVYSYRDFHGRKVTGWQDIDANRYYFGEDKIMVTGWQDLDGHRYHLDTDGTLSTGWFTVGANRYYSNGNGILQTGWQDIEFQRYYLGDDGILRTGWLKSNGNVYYLGQDGAMAIGFTPIEDKYYYFGEDGVLHTGELNLQDTYYFFREDGVMHTGWRETEKGICYYLPDNGAMVLGWQEIGEKRYYFDTEGVMQTGWIQLGEYDYYLHPDGSAAIGPTEIDGNTHYFTPKGVHVVLVNSSNKVPSYYSPNLVTIQAHHRVSEICLEPLRQMLDDCKNAGISYTFNSAYRSVNDQTAILKTRTAEYEATGMGSDAAYRKARESVALPGTSEHHLGLAVDLLGKEAQVWFSEHCWEYGFIVRYMADKQHITGIIDEPWHFRYVGVEVAMELKDSGLCLEEYLGAYPIE